MGICNKVAGAIAPLILGAVVLADADTLVDELARLEPAAKAIRLDELARRVVTPYGIMTVVLVGLAMMIRYSPLTDIQPEADDSGEGAIKDTRTSVFQFPNLVLGVLAIFFCVGVEVIAGDTIGAYGATQGIALSEAKNFTSFTLTAMVLGYIVGIATIPKIIPQAKALAISAVVGIVFSVLAMFSQGYTSVLFIALLGLANALLWPAIWPLAIKGLGRFTKTGSAMMIMGIAGGAILPLAYGAFADMATIGPRLAYWVLIPCYLYLLFFSLKGHKIERW
jgi:glucose/galactose transporter